MQHKFDRKRAIDCKIVRQIDDVIWEYEITVGDKLGNRTTHLQEGKDMADALENLLWIERHDTIEKLIDKASLNAMMIAWIVSFSIPAIASHTMNTPLPIIVSIILNITCFISWWAFHRWVKKNRKIKR